MCLFHWVILVCFMYSNFLSYFIESILDMSNIIKTILPLHLNGPPLMAVLLVVLTVQFFSYIRVLAFYMVQYPLETKLQVFDHLENIVNILVDNLKSKVKVLLYQWVIYHNLLCKKVTNNHYKCHVTRQWLILKETNIEISKFYYLQIIRWTKEIVIVILHNFFNVWLVDQRYVANSSTLLIIFETINQTELSTTSF